jgi:hypothetical protein
MTKNLKPSKQLTLDNLPNVEKESNVLSSNTPEKIIVITEISTTTKEDELALKIAFKLIPSKTAFSKVQLDLYFNDQQINSKTIRIIQGSLAKDDFEITPTLDMRGIPAGTYALKVEMYELWPSGEKLSEVKKEVILDYVPQTRESKFVRVLIVKSVAGTGFSVISESEKDIYIEIEKTMKKEYISNRDDW